MNNSIEDIQNLLGDIFTLSFYEVELFQKALTHSSNNSNNNQRLAFLGDAVLKLIIREHFYINNPDWGKGELTKKSGEEIESDKNFADIAIKLELVNYMDIRNKPSDYETNETINAEALEALFGAIYLSRGLEETRRISEKIIF